MKVMTRQGYFEMLAGRFANGFLWGYRWAAVVRDALSTHSGNIWLCAEAGTTSKRLLHQ